MDCRAEATSHESPAKLSYKFQRLREQIRHAIVIGDLAGQLPGERELGKRFSANAKTINKALCDLATEGLVRRFIGRGTFVSASSSNPAVTTDTSRTVHCLVPPANTAATVDWNGLLASALAARGLRTQPIPARRSTEGLLSVDPARFRSLNQTDAIVLPISAPLNRPADDRPDESLALALARRQIPAVVLGAVAESLRTGAVVPDYNLAAFHAAEYLFQLGCNDVVAVSAPDKSPEILAAVTGYQTSCARRRRENIPIAIKPDDAGATLNSLNGRLNEQTGVLCLGGLLLETVHAALRARRQASALAAVLEPGDRRAADLGITACEFDPVRLADRAAALIAETARGTPPVMLWVPGALQIRPAGGVVDLQESAAEARLGPGTAVAH